ncbi:hypothetical protein CS0771_51560 [Catellatospora sp. IY07-71]|uniref:hypothetical protein n=1 Tax=Catellatospora sp. IY07-71 TaxID=2728827 RepID=UPI001BB44E6B|nr:hypothetical protein [Catellatospora sp. IY07-71]BCJ75612.1 hypothetical protein CS0771_51560 [Catellatospora sp. IY07-71]
MSHDTRTHFGQDLTDEADRDERLDGVPHARRDDDRDGFDDERPADDRDVVDGELVDPADEPEHRHDQDGVVAADRADDERDDVEPVDLDGFGGTTRGGHDVAVPDTDATDDPVHPEARVGDETPTADAHTEPGEQAYDEQTRTLDDLADVEVADDALADQAAGDDDLTGAERDAVEAEAVDAEDVTPDADPVVGGPDAVDPPADVDAVVAAASLWGAGAADDLRERWQAAQLRFVDDPASVAAEMRDLIGETVDRLQQTLAERRQELDEAFSSAGTDTEQLRQAVQRYRDFHQQLLNR